MKQKEVDFEVKNTHREGEEGTEERNIIHGNLQFEQTLLRNVSLLIPLFIGITDVASLSYKRNYNTITAEFVVIRRL